MSWRSRLSSSLNDAIVLKVEPMHPRTDNKPSYVTAETMTVTAMKKPRNILEVENKQVMKRAAATNPKEAAVQCPRHTKCRDIKTQETSRQPTICSLFFN